MTEKRRRRETKKRDGEEKRRREMEKRDGQERRRGEMDKSDEEEEPFLLMTLMNAFTYEPPP